MPRREQVRVADEIPICEEVMVLARLREYIRRCGHEISRRWGNSHLIPASSSNLISVAMQHCMQHCTTESQQEPISHSITEQPRPQEPSFVSSGWHLEQSFGEAAEFQPYDPDIVPLPIVSRVEFTEEDQIPQVDGVAVQVIPEGHIGEIQVNVSRDGHNGIFGMGNPMVIFARANSELHPGELVHIDQIERVSRRDWMVLPAEGIESVEMINQNPSEEEIEAILDELPIPDLPEFQTGGEVSEQYARRMWDEWQDRILWAGYNPQGHPNIQVQGLSVNDINNIRAESKKFAKYTKEYPHLCYKCKKKLNFGEAFIEAKKQKIELDHFKKLWKSKYVEFYCCFCFPRKLKRINILNTIAIREAIESMHSRNQNWEIVHCVGTYPLPRVSNYLEDLRDEVVHSQTYSTYNTVFQITIYNQNARNINVTLTEIREIPRNLGRILVCNEPSIISDRNEMILYGRALLERFYRAFNCYHTFQHNGLLNNRCMGCGMPIMEISELIEKLGPNFAHRIFINEEHQHIFNPYGYCVYCHRSMVSIDSNGEIE